MNRDRHALFREGSIVGILGAATVALWFLVLDLLRGEPLTTPSILGQVLLAGRTSPIVDQPVLWAVVAYTIVHVAAFVALGMLLVKLVHVAVAQNLMRFALVVVFFAFEVFFLGVVIMFGESTAGRFPIWTVLTANTLAAIAMGGYLWRRHPALRDELQREPLGARESVGS